MIESNTLFGRMRYLISEEYAKENNIVMDLDKE